ncbi:hypothetical protein LTR17_021831 [Elasticomyces elasticus]|nr:hypothetical protein LTR17_021831 [Elasticomyces elasticus]
MAQTSKKQVAAAEDNLSMATEAPQQQSKLLPIAPELRNAIYELSLPKSTTIVRVQAMGPRLSYQQQLMYPGGIVPGATLRFHLGLPPLYYVCRSTHNDFPLSEFYASNIFMFTDSITQTGVLEAFFSTCPVAVKEIRSIKVRIAAGSMLKCSPTRAVFDVKFSINKAEDGEVKVGELLVVPKDSVYYDNDVCLCGLLRLAKHGTQHGVTPIEILRDFLALCRAGLSSTTSTRHIKASATTGFGPEEVIATII